MVNIIVPAGNYGWPVVSYGRDYDGTRVSPQPWQEGMLQPEIFWVPSIATSGLMFYTGDKFPQWKNDLFVSALAKQSVHRVRLSEDGKSVLEDEILLNGMGRVRDVVTGPDGAIYVALEKPGRIVKLTPAN